MSKTDNIFADPMQSVADFRFDQNVVDVFDDMIQRSVPGYRTILEVIGQLAATQLPTPAKVIDLGCSLGAASLAVARSCAPDTCEIHAVDSSPAMVERCQRIVNSFTLPNPITVECNYAQNVDIQHADLVIMNFTLQFIEPDERQALMQRIFDGLKPGGMLLLSEKIRHPTEMGNQLLIDLHHDFKRKNGYSELEISQKRAALENVMRTDRFVDHETRLKDVGFSDVVMWFKCYNFTSMIAVKAS